MNEPADLSVYKETLLFLVTAGVVAPLFFRLRISPVLGYLLAGVALGPYGLGSIARNAPWLNALAINVDAIDRIAAFGVVALMFTMGLELSLDALKAHASSGVRAGVRAGRRNDPYSCRRGVASWPQRPFGARDRRGAGDVVDRDRHSHAGREQTASFRGRAREPCGAAVPGYRGCAPARHDRGVIVGGRKRPCVAASHHACSGGARSDRACRFRPPRVAAVLSFCRGDEEPRVLHGGVPARGAGRWARRGGGPSVDGAWRLCRRAPAGGDRIPPRDRSDDRTVPRLAARALLRLGRRRDQSGVSFLRGPASFLASPQR